MATTKIRGITIELGADTSGIKQGLKDVNGQLNDTQRQLKDIDKLLKLDPKNTELLAQKQELLARKVELTGQKVQTLKGAQAELDKQMKNGTNVSKDSYNALTREIIACNNSLDDGAKASEKFASTMSGIGGAVKAAAPYIAAAGAAVGAAAVSIGKEVVSAYGEYEQLIGGVETLFGDSASVVEGYANNAYKTAGLSANAYMETVTSFSASLLQSLDGDTAKAAKYADMAITDMSDNANKMGTDMASIQNAYQGFAKGNYTMLDNLKLGYGGTKTEMERLLADAEKLTGVAYDINSYADVVDAIHAIQTEIGITGTTAKEASTTIQGSISSMSSAWQNMLAGLGDSNANIEELATNLVDSFGTVIDNITPILNNLVAAMPIAIEAMLGAAMELLPTILETMTGMFSSVLDMLIAMLPTLIPIVVQAVVTIVTALADHLPEIFDAAVLIVLELGKGLIKAIPDLLMAASKLVNAVLECVVGTLAQAYQIGGDFVKGLWEGIKDKATWLMEKIGEFASGIIDGIKDLFGIHSPSKVMAGIGKNLALGLGQGWSGELANIGGNITASMGALALPSMAMAGGSSVTNNTTNIYNQTDTKPVQIALQMNGRTLATELYKPLQDVGMLKGASLVR